ncbi:MAG: UDP-N-acetylglucosamine 2-epimerase (hydrolyzing) [Maribacter sp.]|nr:UDP-N-acetylglucosamine 2-epimerase (hydrolyzing) [Candidatus Brocadiaceae bacterium]MCP4978501.1 UDP-N-acetylglucosamine 2-epimerase (hydrolyzing) [Maribacter sp.]
MKKKVCVFIGSRANYSSIKAVMKKLKEADDFELMTVVGASALLDRYGTAVKVIENDGFEVFSKIHIIVEGETPTTMAKSTGLCIMEAATVFDNLKPDYVLVVGDRFEILGVATAAAYMNIPVIHTMGGEISGSIDESVRHVVTKLSHIHFPATELSAHRIMMMGEPKESIHAVGCPRIDEVKEILGKKIDVNNSVLSCGVGSKVNLSKPFLLVLFHPVTTEYGKGTQQVQAIIDVIDKMEMQTIMLWPNVDAGSEDVARGIRGWRELSRLKNFHLFKNLPLDIFIALMDKCACIVGNSSSAIREGAYIGVPAVNVGIRQQGRERGKNVTDVEFSKEEIHCAIEKSIRHGKHERDTLYGDGYAAEKIINILRHKKVNVQKQFVDYFEHSSICPEVSKERGAVD